MAEFGKKRNTYHDFPPPFMWAENNKYLASLDQCDCSYLEWKVLGTCAACDVFPCALNLGVSVRIESTRLLPLGMSSRE